MRFCEHFVKLQQKLKNNLGLTKFWKKVFGNCEERMKL